MKTRILLLAALSGFMKCPLEVTVNLPDRNSATFSLENFENLEDAMRQPEKLRHLILLELEEDPLTAHLRITDQDLNSRFPPGLGLPLTLDLEHSDPNFRIDAVIRDNWHLLLADGPRIVPYETVRYQIRLSIPIPVIFETFICSEEDSVNLQSATDLQALYALEIPIEHIIFYRDYEHLTTISFDEVEQSRQNTLNPRQRIPFCEELARVAVLLYEYHIYEGLEEDLLTEAMYAGCDKVGLLELGSA